MTVPAFGVAITAGPCHQVASRLLQLAAAGPLAIIVAFAAVNTIAMYLGFCLPGRLPVRKYSGTKQAGAAARPWLHGHFVWKWFS